MSNVDKITKTYKDLGCKFASPGFRVHGIEDPEARDKATKAAGLVKGETACNRRACQRPLKEGERWWNTSTHAFYCVSCARRINETETICFLEGTKQ